MSGTEADDLPSQETPTTVAPTTPAEILAAELLATDEFSQYLLNSKSEMFAVFRGLVQHVSQITMFFNEGRDMVLTSLISFSDEGIYLDLGASPETNDKALKAGKLFCVTRLEKVKIQFILRGVKRVATKDGPAFHAALPDSVLRLQRREYYRLATPIARPLNCLMGLQSETAEPRMLEAHVCDISGGGLGVVSIPLNVPLQPGLQCSCRIDLPEVGTVTGTVLVRSVFETATRSGVRSQRAGCEFQKLPGSMLNLIQRYIIKVERDRKARESGMI